MHDATEGGLLNALSEVAEASRVGMRIDLSAVHVPEASAALCRHFRIDPYSAVSLGTLIITTRPQLADEALRRLQAGEIAASQIGEVVPADRGVVVERKGRRTQRLDVAPPDSFWPAFFRGIEDGMP